MLVLILLQNYIIYKNDSFSYQLKKVFSKVKMTKKHPANFVKQGGIIVSLHEVSRFF